MRARVVLAVLASAFVLTACGPPSAGTMGVTVDASGRPVGVLEVCEGHVDGVRLYETPVGDADQSTPAQVVGDWVVSPAVTSSSRLDLGRPTGAWRAETPLAALEQGRSYTLYGWTNDSSWSAGGVEFSREDLELLRPGQVRYDAGLHADEENPEDTTATVSAGEFRARACG
jgi:hypothetical protein